MRYAHVIDRIFGRSLMITPQKAQAIVAGLSDRLGVVAQPTAPIPDRLAFDQDDEREDADRAARHAHPFWVTDQGVAVISVLGTLVHEAATAAPASGMTKYGDLTEMVLDAANDGAVRAVMLDIDSPGGEVASSGFELAETIRAARAVKPVWAVADEMMASAAYLVASGASRIVAPGLGLVGSIGVIAMHLDQSGFDQKQGLKWTFIFAGERKNDFNQHQPLNDAARAQVEQYVNEDYDLFVNAVAAGRPNLTPDRIRATEAAVFRGRAAIDAGLVDETMSFRAALGALTMQAADQRTTISFSSAATMAAAQSTPKEETHMAHDDTPAANAGATVPTGTGEQPAAPTDAGHTVPVGVAGGHAMPPTGATVTALDSARGEERQRSVEIYQLCRLASMPELAGEFVEQGKTVAEVRASLVDRQAAADERLETHPEFDGPGGQKSDADTWRRVLARRGVLKEQARAV